MTHVEALSCLVDLLAQKRLRGPGNEMPRSAVVPWTLGSFAASSGDRQVLCWLSIACVSLLFASRHGSACLDQRVAPRRCRARPYTTPPNTIHFPTRVAGLSRSSWALGAASYCHSIRWKTYLHYSYSTRPYLCVLVRLLAAPCLLTAAE